jgi:hypothetical protein
VLDQEGMVHPFPKKLSLRGIINDYEQMDFEPEMLGGVRAVKPLPLGYLLVTQYNKKIRKPELRLQSSGEGIMAGLANSISVRRTPQFVLKVLGKGLERAVVLQTERGDAGEFADLFLAYLRKNQ